MSEHDAEVPAGADVERLTELADSDSEAIREAVYRHPNRPAERIALLERVGAYTEAVVEKGEEWNDWNGARVGGTPDILIRAAIAPDPTLPFSDFELLLGRGVFARTIATRHPSTPAAVLARIVVHDPSHQVRVVAANHPSLAVETMVALVEAGAHPDLLVGVLQNAAFPSELHVRLAEHESSAVRAMVAKYTKDAALLDGLATEPSASVSYEVAESVHASAAALAAMAGHANKYVRLKVARNPRASIALLETLSADSDRDVACAVASSPRITDAMAANLTRSTYVAWHVVTNPHASEAMRERASQAVRAGGDWNLRSLVAGSRLCPERELVHYARDSSFRVREVVASNPTTPPEALSVLAEDERESIRAEARARLSTRRST